MKILILDDLKEIRDILKELLEDCGHTIEMFSSPISAFKEIKDFKKFDIIISDFDMPDMNGLEFLDTLKKINQTRPFILFSSMILELKEFDFSSVTRTFQKYELIELVSFINMLENYNKAA